MMVIFGLHGSSSERRGPKPKMNFVSLFEACLVLLALKAMARVRGHEAHFGRTPWLGSIRDAAKMTIMSPPACFDDRVNA
jgi:hypothetical protein